MKTSLVTVCMLALTRMSEFMATASQSDIEATKQRNHEAFVNQHYNANYNPAVLAAQARKSELLQISSAINQRQPSSSPAVGSFSIPTSSFNPGNPYFNHQQGFTIHTTKDSQVARDHILMISASVDAMVLSASSTLTVRVHHALYFVYLESQGYHNLPFPPAFFRYPAVCEVSEAVFV